MIAAFFDVDNTLLAGPSVERLFFRYLIAQRMLTYKDIAGTVGFILRCSLDLSGLAMRSRRIYLEGKSVHLIEKMAEECFESVIYPKISLEAKRRIDLHRAQGHRVVLITGSLDLLVRKVAEALKVDDYIASDTERIEGHFTGQIRLPVPYGHGKVYWLRHHAEGQGIDLSQSYAYGDSHADRWVFHSVGHPKAVNPSWRLRRLALQKGWEILQWS